MTKEQKFYKALQDVFIGTKIEGKGGFVNLMRIKSNYYRKIEDILKKDIETALESPRLRSGQALDIAETLSNLTGKWIKKVRSDEVEFEDGTKIDSKNLDYKLIKPLIWWE